MLESYCSSSSSGSSGGYDDSTVVHCLRQLLRLGRNCPSLRNEIICQFIRLLSGHPNTHTHHYHSNPNPNHHSISKPNGSSSTTTTTTSSKILLMRSLCCCLAHFPCSSTFEAYLEVWLLQEMICDDDDDDDDDDDNNSGSGHGGNSGGGSNGSSGGNGSSKDIISLLSERALRLLHESIFRYGYNNKITTMYNSISSGSGDGSGSGGDDDDSDNDALYNDDIILKWLGIKQYNNNDIMPYHYPVIDAAKLSL